MNIKVIETQDDYEKALRLIEELMDKNPRKGTTFAHKLELMTLLISDYEERSFPSDPPDPIDAIRFRMEQGKLTQRDLIAYIGSRSKVSEILSGKRPLTLSMIRALHSGLGIPLESLLNPQSSGGVIEWSRFPIVEMKKRGWIQDIKSDAEQIVSGFLRPLESDWAATVLYRMTDTDNIRSARTMDRYALMAWNARVVMRANSIEKKARYRSGSVNKKLMHDLVQLSVEDDSPRLAYEFLEKNGIPLIIEPHLSKTYLDGAAIMSPNGPIIGLTSRYDRLDNFWFCLMHELAHVSLHLENTPRIIFDDLDSGNSNDPIEIEADQLAGEVLIPEGVWETSPARTLRSPAAAESLARKLNVNVAIVAGRMRHHFRSYRILTQLIGKDQVRRCFPNIEWRQK
jgi:HTH-type transcriptional regulator/antitoxin HigA